jgi:hypothetical protein
MNAAGNHSSKFFKLDKAGNPKQFQAAQPASTHTFFNKQKKWIQQRNKETKQQSYIQNIWNSFPQVHLSILVAVVLGRISFQKKEEKRKVVCFVFVFFFFFFFLPLHVEEDFVQSGDVEISRRIWKIGTLHQFTDTANDHIIRWIVHVVPNRKRCAPEPLFGDAVVSQVLQPLVEGIERSLGCPSDFLVLFQESCFDVLHFDEPL